MRQLARDFKDVGHTTASEMTDSDCPEGTSKRRKKGRTRGERLSNHIGEDQRKNANESNKR
jgi:hypothetical protein